MTQTHTQDYDPFEEAEKRSLSHRALHARSTPYLEGLNTAQKDAVEALDGPVLVLAGAGTGKTRVLTTRIAHLLNSGHARPNEILAVTFTNKAALEMKSRIGGLLGGVVEGMPWLGTFHAICVKLLRRHAELVGLKPNFTILDTDDQLRLLKQLIKAYNIDEKRYPPRLLAGIIDQWKNRGWTCHKVPSSEAHAFSHKGIELYQAYQERLKTLNACDFGDLLLHMLVIFQTHQDVLEKYQNWFRYILVDEYQDTNVAQYLWLRLLAHKHKNICCVGDDDQSIYGWRGAEVGNILKFESDFPNATIIRLEQNYRSTEHILAAASNIIRGNESRLGKTLWTEEKGGDKLRLIGHWDGEEEARWIGEDIEAHHSGLGTRARVSLNEMAILVRASHQMRTFEDRFLNIGLPYRVIGGPRFYERLEIRDAMAYFRLVVSSDDDLAFERVINTPKRGLGDKARQDIARYASQNGVSQFQSAKDLLEAGHFSAKARASLREFVESIQRWQNLMAKNAPSLAFDPPEARDTLPHYELAGIILDESGYTAMWQNDKSPESEGRLENLKELVKALEDFENLQGFLEHVSLVMDNNSNDASEKVSIMTLHGAKGLEFEHIYLPGWEDGLFPSQRSMDENGMKGLEEERRLAYVGITRARKLCTISFASNRRVYNQWQNALPSRFIDELPENHVDVLTQPGLSQSGFSHKTAHMEQRAAQADVYNSPGWKRMQSHQDTHIIRTPSEAKKILGALSEPSHLKKSDRVFHQKFGYGIVTSIDGNKLEVDFKEAGVKKVVASFVSLADDVPF